MYPSPDVRNYTILKGNVFFRADGETEKRHLGNVPSFTITPEVEVLDHYSAMGGTRVKDHQVVVEQNTTCELELEEFTLDNLKLYHMAEEVTDSEDGTYLAAHSVVSIRGELEIVGTNDVGRRVRMVIPAVSIRPSGEMQMVESEAEWSSFNIEAEALKLADQPLYKVWLLPVAGSTEGSSEGSSEATSEATSEG